MKILLFGKNGQVGWELHRSLQVLGETVALGRTEADFSSPEDLRGVLRSIRPDVIVNAVAYTAVDKAEEEEDIAAVINGEAPRVIAEEAQRMSSLFVHYSTDYVFDGAKHGQYTETDEPNPINAYGRTKLVGERAVHSSGCDYLVLRTSWVYAHRGNNFLLTMLRLAEREHELSVVGDQTGAPTFARSIAEATNLCIHQAYDRRISGNFSPGTYHLSSSGHTSWHGFCEEIVKTAEDLSDIQLKLRHIRKIASADYPTAAKRPLNSCISSARIMRDYRILLPDWKVALRLCMEELFC